MKKMKAEYIEKIYSGWLAKVIGVRLGAPIEGWAYDKIQAVFGELKGYPRDYKQFAADDDTNGPIFFIRALEDSKNGYDISAQDVGDALLNYASYEQGFFWWGGYGISTEHTSYLNQRLGIPAPQSGSIEQNGATIAEQIGGQIFIDSWGLVCPGNPDLAAKYAEKAASVTHGGNGVYGGMFIASCISYAFVEQDITAIIEKGLSYIPADCEYTRVVRAVMKYHEEHPDNWRDCFAYIFENFGYSKYPGNCHIAPNIAVMILALLYGNGDFADTLNICNMCGWDTDCNVGNIATIMGVRNGLEAIDYDQLRKPINDILICSSVMGSLNIMDIPYGASYMVKLAAAIAGEELPEPWDDILNRRLDGCHFEYPGSTHGMRVRVNGKETQNSVLRNTDEAAYTGKRSLSVALTRIGGKVFLYKKTYYIPKDFNDSRYDPSFSPVLYPGQTITGSLYLPEDGCKCKVRPYVHNATTDEIIMGPNETVLEVGKWSVISMQIPAMEAALIDEAGFILDSLEGDRRFSYLRVLLDDFYFGGKPNYTVDFSKSHEEFWNPKRSEISQFTKLRGIYFLEGGKAHLTSNEFAEIYTGGYDWEDYSATFRLTPVMGGSHMVNVRVQGAIRSYAAGFVAGGKLALCKNDKKYVTLVDTEYAWEYGKEYAITVTAIGNKITVSVDGKQFLTYVDEDHPYLKGAIGMSIQGIGHSCYSNIVVESH